MNGREAYTLNVLMSSIDNNFRLNLGLILLGFCLFLIPMTSLLAQGSYGNGNTFNYGQILQNTEQIRAMRQRRELEHQRYQQQQQQQQQEAWERERLLREDAQRRELQQQQQQAQKPPATTHAPQEIISRFESIIKYRRYKYEDFNEVVYDDNLSITLDMIALMSESEYAADIAYYLGKHPDETAAVSKMALPQAGAAIFAIEEKLIQNNFQVE
jgi:hypothetical protein